jgi:hypothetical protein
VFEGRGDSIAAPFFNVLPILIFYLAYDKKVSHQVFYVGFNQENLRHSKIMIPVSAYPTVEWLRSRACDRQAVVSTIGRRQCLPPQSNRFVSRLKEVVSRRVVVEQGVWISTPEGEVEVHIVLKNGGKRVAICLSESYSTGSSMSDSLVLIYGRFDGLYRIESDKTIGAMHDALYALMCDKSGWFSNFGRLSIGRLVSNLALIESNAADGHQMTILETENVKVSRMRMCKANDWVTSFEQALDVNIRFRSAK